MKTTFKKTVKSEGIIAEAIIEVTEDFNKKGEPFRNVNFVNTSPANSFEAAKKFEDYELEFDQLVRVLNHDGFSAN
jgi:hypothetical protein